MFEHFIVINHITLGILHSMPIYDLFFKCGVIFNVTGYYIHVIMQNTFIFKSKNMFFSKLLRTNFKNITGVVFKDINCLITTNNLVSTFKGHSSSVESVCPSPYGRFVAAGSDNGPIRIWDIDTGKIVKTLKAYRLASNLCYSPYGRFLAFGDHDKTIKICNTKTGTVFRTFEGNSHRVTSACDYSPCGRFLAVGDGYRNIKIWNVNTGKLVKTLKGHANSIVSLRYTPRGRFIIAGGSDGKIIIWNVNTGNIVVTLTGHSDSVSSIDCSPDGKFFASGSFDKTIKIWDLSTGKCIKTLVGHFNWISSIRYNRCGNFIFSASFDKTIQMWDVNTGISLKALFVSCAVKNICCSSYGNYIISGNSDKTIKKWRVTRKVHSQEIQQLLNALKTNTCVTSLDLSLMWLQPADVFALCKLLSVNKHIVSVNLSHTYIGKPNIEKREEIPKMLRTLLKTNTALKYLDLSNNEFTDVTAAYLFDGLKHNQNSSLISLNLACNHINCGNGIIENHFEVKQENLEVDLSSNALFKECKKVITGHRNFRTPPPKFPLSSSLSLIFDISSDKWLVAIGAFRGSITGNHAFCLIEGVRKDGQRFLFRCDLTTDSTFRGNAKITTNITNPFAGKYVIGKKSKYTFRVFKDVDKLKAKMLRTKMQEAEERNKKINYSIIKNSRANTHNCISWIIDRIIECNIPTEAEKKELGSWLVKTVPVSGAGNMACIVM